MRIYVKLKVLIFVGSKKRRKKNVIQCVIQSEGSLYIRHLVLSLDMSAITLNQIPLTPQIFSPSKGWLQLKILVGFTTKTGGKMIKLMTI